MTEHINSWKNKEIFQDQLGLNKDQLDNNYPSHWLGFLSLMKTIENNITSFVVLGLWYTVLWFVIIYSTSIQYMF